MPQFRNIRQLLSALSTCGSKEVHNEEMEKKNIDISLLSLCCWSILVDLYDTRYSRRN